MDGQEATVIDSGIVHVYTSLGIIGGTVFFLSFGLLVAQTFRATGMPHMHLYRAVAVGTFLQLPFGSVHVGETGFGAWICVGLALTSTVASPAAE
jgi:hypothetical protein